jgi:hypothetical protein
MFPATRAWRQLSGRLMPPIDNHHLVRDLLERFVQARGDPELGLTNCLQALAAAWQGHDC